ncbi:GntR family transcriptional regulator [Paenibacillus aurantius]|uniref:GntR family transcriptional regulator n=1 Tax=Paenibacillus aurantius TaxID=2918900 RepID=A0AA96LKH7_9BACL|nr:GntR family transcriptional regulator [Paenibacillus aurantius]WNQ13067.1 GntR family transcriptional regulator [Paenibacillus aurantius]
MINNENKPLYMVIKDDLKMKITMGEYSPEAQVPTEAELAELYGVSRITSKRALVELEREGLIYRKRGSGSFVKQLGEREDSGELVSPIISMIVPFMASYSMPNNLKGASDYLDAHGYFLSIHNSDWSLKKERELLTKLPKSGSRAIILYPVSSSGNIEILSALHSNGYPIVTIDQYIDGLGITSVTSDNYAGGYETATRLIREGHTRIAYVSSISITYRSTVRDRYFGYCQAHRENGLTIDPEIVITDYYRQVNDQNARAFYSALLHDLMHKGVTAILTENDYVGVELLKCALEMGIPVPEKVAIVGFDNEEMSQHLEVPLSTVEQNYYEIGYKAAELVVRMIYQDKSIETRNVVPVNFIERQSTRKQPKGIDDDSEN